MIAKIQKWGNSQGIRFPKTILQEASMAVGDELDVIVQDGQITLRRSSRIRGKHKLEELVARIPEDYETHEEDWGGAIGKEAW